MAKLAADERSSLTGLLKALSNDSPVPDRLRALGDLGFSTRELASAIGETTPEAIKGWERGSRPRGRRAQALDHVRLAARILLETVPPEGVHVWFTSKPGPRSTTPLELIATEPARVLSAAEAHNAGLEEEEQALLTLDGDEAQILGRIGAKRF